MACQCNLSDLLQRSIELIDPPPSEHASKYTANDDVAIISSASKLSVLAVAPDADDDDVAAVANAKAADDALLHESDRDDGGQHHSSFSDTIKKKVRFCKSVRTSPKKALISSIDAMRAYELLMHAISISLLPPPSSNTNTPFHFNGDYENASIKYIGMSTSWKALNDVVDIYRALLVTSCLLMELLPLAHLDEPNNGTEPHHPPDQCTIIHQHRNDCPLQCPDSSHQIIPTLTISNMNELLSTSRRCINQLQSLEQLCAVKTISEQHLIAQKSAVTSNYLVSLHEGGDDIQDYDRPVPDWYDNYDWHDDGFLPLPFFHHADRTCVNGGICNDVRIRLSQRQQYSLDDVTKSNILFECCYRPQYPNDPPSSRFEKVAWTREWIRGERLISLCVEDYQYCPSSGCIDTLDFREGGSDVHSEELFLDDESNFDEGNVSLDISSAVLAEEESCLLEVMLADAIPSSQHGNSCDVQHPSTKKRARNMKEVRKKKRLKLKQKKELQKQDHSVVVDQKLQSQSIRGREGFLLLVREETTGGILPPPFMNTKAKTIRVFARLHPSGWLSIEDRSIRRQICTANTDEESMQCQPLVPRARYYDFFVGPKTTCQPWIRNGVTSFHFRLACLHFLGKSSLLPSSFDGNSSNHESHNIDGVDLLFSIDEGTGGDFADGFEWVNCASRAQ